MIRDALDSGIPLEAIIIAAANGNYKWSMVTMRWEKIDAPH